MRLFKAGRAFDSVLPYAISAFSSLGIFSMKSVAWASLLLPTFAARAVQGAFFVFLSIALALCG